MNEPPNANIFQIGDTHTHTEDIYVYIDTHAQIYKIICIYS